MQDNVYRSFRRARREALVAVLIFLAAGGWTITVSWFLGYHRPAEAFWGIPVWVLLGVLFPWVICFLIHCWYSLSYLTVDETAGSDPDPEAERGR